MSGPTRTFLPGVAETLRGLVFNQGTGHFQAPQSPQVVKASRQLRVTNPTIWAIKATPAAANACSQEWTPLQAR
jgi:hypothetical protein